MSDARRWTQETRSFVLKEAMDYSTALFDARGEMIAQGTCLPLHLGSMPEVVRAVLRTYGGTDTVTTGDVFALNDPYGGGSHLPDVITVKPVFAGDARRLLLAHGPPDRHRRPRRRRDACDSTENYREGLRLPPIRLYEHGCTWRAC